MVDDRTVVALMVDGKRYEICFEDCTALDAKDCRRQTGLSLSQIFGSAADAEPDLDSVAALVWLARRKAGERELAFDRVAASISYGTPFESTAKDDTDEVARDPE